MRAVDERVPGDVSAAAFWLVAGAIHPDAELTPPRRRRQPDPAGGHRPAARDGRRSIERGRRAAPTADRDVGEPIADLTVRSSRAARHRARAARRRGGDRRDPGPVPRRDAGADGTTRIRGAGELRHKESDRIAGIVAGPRARSARESTSTATTSRSTARPRCAAPPTDSLDDHRLAMTFAIAGLVAAGETVGRPARQRRDLVPRLLRRPRKDPSMTKRVVLIGHPVAHSLSGAMQQAAFDDLGIDATLRALGPRADRARRTRSPSCAATTSWARTSRSRTRSGSSRSSTG